jgi:hypothetical protein
MEQQMTQPPDGQDPQSPYGQNPSDPPTPPSEPPTQPIGQPEQPYGQPTQPYGQPGPYGPPPVKKSRAGLIVLVVLLVLLIVGGGVTAAVLLAGNDSNNKASDTPSQSTSAPTSAPTSSTPTVPSSNAIQGNGYSFTLPTAWQDVSEEASGAPGAIDTIAVWGSKLQGGRANVIVESGPTGGATDPENLRSQWESNMSGATGTSPKKIDGTTIDGESAIGARITRTGDKGVAIVQTAYLVIHNDTAYSIALSGRAGDTDAETAFTAILGSWAWA